MDALKVISAKKLDKKYLENAKKYGIDIYDYDFVYINYINNKEVFEKVNKNTYPFIFTSQYALKAIQDLNNLNCKKAYCIKGKTSVLAEKLGFTMLGTGNNSLELAKTIEKSGEKKVCHLTTNIRRDELYNYLKNIGIEVNIVEVYEKKINPIKIDFRYDAVLFFSPSQVDAFFEKNNLYENTVCFCIGDTTASYLKQLCTNEVITSKSHSEESLIEEVIKYYTSP